MSVAEKSGHTSCNSKRAWSSKRDSETASKRRLPVLRTRVRPTEKVVTPIVAGATRVHSHLANVIFTVTSLKFTQLA